MDVSFSIFNYWNMVCFLSVNCWQRLASGSRGTSVVCPVAQVAQFVLIDARSGDLHGPELTIIIDKFDADLYVR